LGLVFIGKMAGKGVGNLLSVAGFVGAEIRNPKLEIRMKYEIRNAPHAAG
jgi:hypothetical protein